MSRYVEADALEYDTEWSEYHDGFTAYSQLAIDTAPSIDIVFCKECKHNYNTAINHGKMQPRCDFTDWKLTENDYCSRGERKESE